MGRPAKYLTHEDRLRARRIRRAAQSHLPQMQMARKRDSKRWYEKKRGIKLLNSPPLVVADSVRAHAEADLFTPDYTYLVRQFLQGRDNVSLDDIDIEEQDFKALTGLPPYPRDIVSMANFEADWPTLRAAMYGYARSQYLSKLEELARSSTTKQSYNIAFDLFQERKRLEFVYDLLERAYRSYIDLNQHREAILARHNIRWHCRIMEYNRVDIETLKKGYGDFLRGVLERKWDLARVPQEM